jgi:hypothetical protein
MSKKYNVSISQEEEIVIICSQNFNLPTEAAEQGAYEASAFFSTTNLMFKPENSRSNLAWYEAIVVRVKGKSLV